MTKGMYVVLVTFLCGALWLPDGRTSPERVRWRVNVRLNATSLTLCSLTRRRWSRGVPEDARIPRSTCHRELGRRQDRPDAECRDSIASRAGCYSMYARLSWSWEYQGS
jgi:hypothetical protein